jgi:hypothetical protein
MSLGMGESPLDPDDPAYAWRFLAEGDSWFTIGAMQLLVGIELGRMTLQEGGGEMLAYARYAQTG